ncbi:hypothetical protein IAR55_000306 [Kwoniella newhampshirensis]|uniref:Major facilitator superfamily (MFS) profile domain-containing protein n=1 Tax=Kwoniella newhampshirensis TaxID=1651941 RepID=A0AAW0Z6C8_9TREE
MFGKNTKSGQTPLPFAQVAVLMGVRLAEPIIFPFINQMVEELKVTDNPDRIGFYSGLVESVFAFVQFFTVYHWATMSDKIGRKPIILFGLVGVAISGSLFGLATSFWLMIFYRCLSGALNGNAAVIKAAIGDITDESNSTEAFAMYGLAWTVGAIIGNSLGGTLSHPYEQYPSLFGSFSMLETHPYLLPCLVAAGCTLAGFIFCSIFYQESLPATTSSRNRRSFSLSMLASPFAKNHKRHLSTASLVSEAETLVDPEAAAREELLGGKGSTDRDRAGSSGTGVVREGRDGAWSIWELLRFRKVKVMCGTYFLSQFVQAGWTAASLLFFFDRYNGLGMSAQAIGVVMAINGFWTIACQILLLTRLRNWFGISLAYKILSVGWPLVWVLLPMLRNVLLATETSLPPDPVSNPNGYGPEVYAVDRRWPTTVCVNLYLSFVTLVGMSNGLLMVLVNFASPDKTALGAMNGIGTAAGCMARVIGPSLVSALYAISMDGKVLGGRLWWIFMAFMSVINFGVTLLIERDKTAAGLRVEGGDGVGGGNEEEEGAVGVELERVGWDEDGDVDDEQTDKDRRTTT